VDSSENGTPTDMCRVFIRWLEEADGRVIRVRRAYLMGAISAHKPSQLDLPIRVTASFSRICVHVWVGARLLKSGLIQTCYDHSREQTNSANSHPPTRETSSPPVTSRDKNLDPAAYDNYQNTNKK
jgi:hypothetical protein